MNTPADIVLVNVAPERPTVEPVTTPILLPFRQIVPVPAPVK